MNFTFLFFFVLFCEVVTFTDALKANDRGVCVVSRSVRKTRAKNYRVRINKMCGTKRCIVVKTKVEAYKQTQNETVCCNGWIYESQADACSPSCSTGCNGGRCIAPEVCQCDPPAILHPEHKNSCFTPTCEPACLNGICVAPDTCSCHEGYENINGRCQAKCESCIHGECKTPNVCECFAGYNMTDGICNPICDGCKNGVCTAPYTCECNEGYTKNVTSINCRKPCPDNCKSCDDDGICLDGVCG
ncbi:epidermal growth factor-like protein [Vanessa tameamea]|uniref:Epidermal growth factor-like protein n=1 Tax=Vanessa tameamea TaxID=334116 RepID=A0ABM4AJL1_VANTA